MNLVTKSSTSSFPSSQRCMMHDKVAETLVMEARSKMVSLVNGGEPKGRSLCEMVPKGQLQMVWVPFETLSTPPVNAPFIWQDATVSSTLDQSQYCVLMVSVKEIINRILVYILYNNRICSSVNSMKAMSTSQQQSLPEVEHGEPFQKRLAELQQVNKQKEMNIANLQKEVALLQTTNKQLTEELEAVGAEWQKMQEGEGEEKVQQEEEQEMAEWIENVQKLNGLPQSAIDSLLTMEFEGGEQQICLSCYSQLGAGSMCTYLPCSHLFHQPCIANHLRVNRHCPACQEEVLDYLSNLYWAHFRQDANAYNIIMTQLKKYHRLGQTLRQQQQERAELPQEADFYFRQLERLQVDLLVGQIETAEQRRQIAALESKIELIRQEHKQIDQEQQRVLQESSEEVDRAFACPLKECGKRFQKQTGLRLHSMLMHSASGKWRQGSLLRLWVEE